MSRFVLTAQLQLQAPNNVAQVVRQIQSQLNNVNVNVQVQGTAQAQRQLQQVTTQTQAATTAADRMGRAFAISIRRFAAFSIATRAVGLFTSTLSDAIKTAIDFEREMVRVSQVTGESIGKLQFLTKAITDLSTGLGVSSKDLLTTGQLLLQAGVNAKDTEVALKTLAKAALAPNFDSLSETTEGAIAILAQFQEGVGALEKQLGAINAVAGAFAVEAGDLIDVIRRAGGVFKASGGDLNELIALFTSVRATTRESAESIGTGLRTIFTRIQRPKTIEYLKQFGVELVDLEGKFVGPYEAVRRLSTALSGLGEGDITFIRIAEELGGFRQIGKVLPLLQQFSTAQAALNVAQKAGNSLATDAATAQQALAIRILKVKEEFLALIRSVTETSTFQVMANTALSLASALIKIGEAIKPLLPLLAAVAAVNFAKGIGTFAGGLMRGMQSGRTYNKGGKVHHFARGGMVPGTGNRDTVPAMLQPGEFVIKKSSVNKLGASNLAAMNENRYAAGGIVTSNRNNYGPSLNQSERRKLSFLMNPPKGTRLSDEDKKLRDELSARKNISATQAPDMKTAYLKDGIVGGLFLQKGSGGTKGITKILQGQEIPGFPDVKQVKGNVYTGLLDSKASTSLRSEIEPAISKAVENASINTMRALEIPPLDINEKSASQNAVKRIDIGSIEGHIFEAFISAMSGANLSDPGASFDFINPTTDAKTRLKNIFGPDPVIGKLLDAKRSLSTDTMLSAPNSIANKTISAMKAGLLSPSDFVMKNLGGVIQKFAVGGEAQKVANMMGKGKALADSWWTGMFAGNNVLFDWAAPTRAFKIPTGEEVPIDQNLRKVLREKAQREWMTFQDKMTKERDAKKKPLTPEEKASLAKYSLSPEQVEQIKKEAEAKRAKAYVDRTSGINWDVENSGRRRRRPEDYIRRSRGFATGGSVGTDTVPALLTPGEFVLNRSSAQSIGYGNLNRMNKVGRYAKGGVVQHFNKGSSGTGVKSGPDLVGPQAFNINPKIFMGLEKTVFSLMDLFRGLGNETAKNIAAFSAIQKVVPELVDSVRSNSIANNRTKTAQEKIAIKYAEQIVALQNQGKTNAEIQAIMARYISALDKDTQAKNKSASSATAATATAATATIKGDPGSGAVQAQKIATAAQASVIGGMDPKSKAMIEASMKKNIQAYDKLAIELDRMGLNVKDSQAAYKSMQRSLDKGLPQQEAYNKAIESAHSSITKSGKTVRESPQQQLSASERFKAAGSPLEKQQIFLEEKAKTGTLTNKEVGKGLGAGMSQAQAKAIIATNNQAKASMEAAKADQTEANASNKAAQADQKKSAMMGRDFGSMAIGLSMVSGTIQAMLPPLEENSGLLLQMGHGLLGIITTVTGLAFALSAFGVTVTGSTIASAAAAAASFFMGTAGAAASTACLTLAASATTAAAATGGFAATMLTALSALLVGLAPLAAAFVAIAGPILAVVAAAWLLNKAMRGLIDMIWGDANKMKKQAIEKGDVANAGKYAEVQTRRDNASAGLGGGAIVGAIIGTFFGGPVGAAIGGAIGAGIGALIGAYFPIGIESARKYAEAQAGAVRVTKALESAQKNGAAAMEKFNKGLISTSELLDAYAPASGEVSLQNTRVTESVKANAESRSEYGSGKILRNLGAYLGGGLFGMETAGTRNQRLEKESVDLVEQQKKSVTESFAQSRDARNASMRSALFRGVDPEKELKEKGMDTGSMRQERIKIIKAAGEAEGAGRKEESKRLFELAAQYEEEINNTEQAMANLKKEVELAKAKFAALNLGFRSVTAAADASALRMQQAMSSFDLAAIPGVNAMQTLEAALTAAGQNISKAEFDSSLGEVSNILKKFGADAKQVTAFEDLTKGVAAVQRDFPNIFDTLKQRLKGGEKDMSPEALGKEFKNIVAESLDKAGIGETAKKRIIDSMGDVQINPEDMAKLIEGGDVSVLEKYFGDAAEEVGKNVKGFMDKWISANQELITATQQRIEAERNLVAAQKEAVDLYMEGREVQAKYGGRAVSTEERRAAIVAKANAGASGAGIGAMRTGSVAELRQRQTQIFGGFGRIEGMRGREDSAMGAKGQELEGTQQNLQQAQKDQVETIRALIKLEEEELKIIQEKNKLEKDSLESLISGDIEKFFEQQSALGAQAAIASGDTQFASLFGADTLGKAFQDMQRQMEAGVQSMFGQQLGGPGGLLERAAGTALSARGVTDPRSAQVLAGSTAEEESIKRTLQDLGGVLGEAGAAGAAMAEMQVQTAQMKVEKAEIVIANLDTGGAPPAAGMYRGGVVYANRGMFVPRGTDTVPAMLTPGEFVVRRESVNRGNNLQLLQAINSGNGAAGMARGGKVGYYNNGGRVQYKSDGGILGNIAGAFGIDPQLITNLGNIFNTFVSGFNDSIKNLQNTKLQVKLDSVNVNVNLNSSSMLNEISQQAKQNIIGEVIQKLQSEYGIGSNGRLQENKSDLNFR